MTFPDPNEPIPAEESFCAICGAPVEATEGHVRFAIRLHAGRVRRGKMHVGCAPPDVGAWCAARSAL